VRKIKVSRDFQIQIGRLNDRETAPIGTNPSKFKYPIYVWHQTNDEREAQPSCFWLAAVLEKEHVQLACQGSCSAGDGAGAGERNASICTAPMGFQSQRRTSIASCSGTGE
jgi:hypothetical protein